MTLLGRSNRIESARASKPRNVMIVFVLLQQEQHERVLDLVDGRSSKRNGNLLSVVDKNLRCVALRRVEFGLQGRKVVLFLLALAIVPGGSEAMRDVLLPICC